jgi:GNAT superfamily N-acetyltransferase
VGVCTTGIGRATGGPENRHERYGTLYARERCRYALANWSRPPSFWRGLLRLSGRHLRHRMLSAVPHAVRSAAGSPAAGTRASATLSQHRLGNWSRPATRSPYRVHMAVEMRQAQIGDESALFVLFDEAVLWLTERGLDGQWGSQPWSERPEKNQRVANLARSPGTTVAQMGNDVVGVIEVNEQSPWYVPVTGEPSLYVDLLLTSRRFMGQGIGVALLECARADCHKRDVSLLRVDCWAGGDRQLVRYYESVGFTATEAFDRDGWPGQLLVQRLGA